jgi:hypothetical protein
MAKRPKGQKNKKTIDQKPNTCNFPFQVAGSLLWFRLHQLQMTAAILFTLIGALVIFIDEGFFPYSSEEIGKNRHPATGGATIILAIIQPIMGALRPNQGIRRVGVAMFVPN